MINSVPRLLCYYQFVSVWFYFSGVSFFLSASSLALIVFVFVLFLHLNTLSLDHTTDHQTPPPPPSPATALLNQPSQGFNLQLILSTSTAINQLGRDRALTDYRGSVCK